MSAASFLVLGLLVGFVAGLVVAGLVRGVVRHGFDPLTPWPPDPDDTPGYSPPPVRHVERPTPTPAPPVKRQ